MVQLILPVRNCWPWKEKSQLFYHQKWIYLGIAENCSSGQASHSETHRQVQGTLFYREKGESWEGSFWTKAHWRKSESSGWWWFLIGWVAGVIRFLEEMQPTPCTLGAKINDSCTEVCNNWWILHLASDCTVWELSLLASWFSFVFTEGGYVLFRR